MRAKYAAHPELRARIGLLSRKAWQTRTPEQKREQSAKVWATRRANGTDKLKNTRATRRAAGLCVQCGCQSADTKMCLECSKKRSDTRRHIEKVPCPKCGKLKLANTKLCRICNDMSHRESVECERCGRMFTKILSSKKRVCSIACRNAALAAKPRPYAWGKDIGSRIIFEYRLMAELMLSGWACFRSRGSRGPADVFAFNKDEFRCIQVKSTNDPTARKARGFCVRAVELLQGMPAPPVISKWICLWVKDRGWVAFRIDTWPRDRQNICRLVREALAA